MGKWYTCAPCHFGIDEAFFRRDSGLLCRGLQALGHESKVVLLGPSEPTDSPDTLRAKLLEMESADWWRALQLDGVIMVAWARHRDTPIVRAIAASGTPLVLHVDGTGIAYPIFDHLETFKTLWREERGTERAWGIRAGCFLKAAAVLAVKLLVRQSYLKYRHLRYPTLSTFQTPGALERTRRLCSFFGGKAHGIRLQLIGCPIPPDCQRIPAVAKEKRIVAIGRWDDLRQKRPYVLMRVCAAVARLHTDLQIDIFGTRTEALARWHAALDADLRERIHLHGVQPGELLAKTVQKAQISFFPSSFEGVPLSLFECLACGVTTVGLDSADLPGTRWAAACGHGELARRDTTEEYVEALDRGLKKWERGEYSPEQISAYWMPKTQCSQILQDMIAAVREAPASPVFP